MTTVVFSHGQESGPRGTKVRAIAARVTGMGCSAKSGGYRGIVAGYDALTPPPPDLPICIVHGWHDDIVPAENSIRFARSCAATLHLVDGDHRSTAYIDEINE